MASSSNANITDPSTVKQTIVAYLEPPRLKRTTTANFNEFLRERELYEKHVVEKNLTPA